MAWDKIAGVIGSAIEPITQLIDSMHTSPEEKLKMEAELNKIQNELTVKVLEVQKEELQAQKEIIIAEAKGGFLQKNWRPILMLSVVAIIVNNYILYPYLSLFTDKVVVLELPEKLYNLMMIGVGGYVAGRSTEKVVETIKKK